MVIPHLQLAHPTATTIRMEQSRAFRAEHRSSARLHCQTQNRTLLVAKEVSVDDPLRIHTVARKFSSRNGRTRILQHKVRVLIRRKIELLYQVLPVLMPALWIVLFAARIKCIRRSNPTVQCQVFSQEMLVHRHVQLMRAQIGR